VWVQETGTNRISGYTFTQQIVVKISNLTGDALGAVVDTAVKAGGDNLQAGAAALCTAFRYTAASGGKRWQTGWWTSYTQTGFAVLTCRLPDSAGSSVTLFASSFGSPGRSPASRST
jgi:hypothetical protein